MNIIKHRKGKAEKYDENKVHNSVKNSCYVVKLADKECKRIATEVTKKITAFVRKKKKVGSVTLAKEVAKELKKHDKDAGFMYETHMDVS